MFDSPSKIGLKELKKKDPFCQNIALRGPTIMMSGNFRETHTLLTSCMRLPVYPVNPEIEVICQVLKISVQVQVCWRALSHPPSQL